MRKLFSLGIAFMSFRLFAACSGEPQMSDAIAPDTRVFETVKSVITSYGALDTISDWTFKSDDKEGTFESGWYRTHKGEVRLQIHGVVWGESYRISVYHNTGWIFTNCDRTDTSRRLERSLQQQIDAKLGRIKTVKT